jgi:ABC-type amino acid transport substrate-binding protein
MNQALAELKQSGVFQTIAGKWLSLYGHLCAPVDPAPPTP